MKIEWIDGSITPSLHNTNIRLLILRDNGDLSLGIFTPTDGWLDILASEEISKLLIQCYARINKPKKNYDRENRNKMGLNI